MKEFFKYMFASMLGFLLISIIIIGIFALIVVGIVAGNSDKTVTVADNSILTIKFDKEIPERTPNNPLDDVPFLNLDDNKSAGLNDILSDIKRAKTDGRIKGIFLDQSDMLSGQ